MKGFWGIVLASAYIVLSGCGSLTAEFIDARPLRRLAMLSSSVSLEDSLTAEATAGMNPAYAFVADS